MQVGPQGAAVTLKNNIIVTDALQKRLEVFTAAGASLSKWGLGKFFNPCAVAVSRNGNCVVSDTADHSVSVYRGEHTCVARLGGAKGARDDQFDNPLYVAAGPGNEIVVSDSNNHCVKVSLARWFHCRQFTPPDTTTQLRVGRCELQGLKTLFCVPTDELLRVKDDLFSEGEQSLNSIFADCFGNWFIGIAFVGDEVVA